MEPGGLGLPGVFVSRQSDDFLEYLLILRIRKTFFAETNTHIVESYRASTIWIRKSNTTKNIGRWASSNIGFSYWYKLAYTWKSTYSWSSTPFSFTLQHSHLLPETQQLKEYSKERYQVGCVNCQKMSSPRMQIYRTLRANLLGFSLWPSHQTVSYWYLALTTTPSSSGIPPQANCGRPLKAIPIGSGQRLMLVYLFRKASGFIFRGEKTVWLPLEYRPFCLAMKDGVLASWSCIRKCFLCLT